MTLHVGISTSSFGTADRSALDELVRNGVEIHPNPYGRRLSEQEAMRFVVGKDGLLAGVEPLTRQVMELGCPRLRAIARVGVGMDNVDLRAASDLGIRVSNTPEGPTDAVAEMTLGALLTLQRRIRELDSDMHRGTWAKQMGTGLADLKVLLVGYGRIGRRTAVLLRAFGCEILVCDPAVAPTDLAHGERLVDLDEGLVEADVVSLHASGTEPILNASRLSRIRRGAVLLNPARGELVDEGAVMDALRSGVLKAAWFDCFSEEPYTGPLAGLSSCLLTPHCATYTDHCRRSMELQAVRHLLRDLDA